MRFETLPKLKSLAVLALVLAGPLSACTSMDDVHDAIESVNPFAEKQKILPGTRVAVLPDGSPSAIAKNRTVTIPGPRAAGNWPQAGGPAANNPGHLALNGPAAGRAWAASAGDVVDGGMTRATIRAFARPVVSDGRVYVYDPAGNVSAHSLANGGRVWRVSTRPEGWDDDPSTGGGVASDGARVYASTGYSTVVALDASSGAKAWEFKLGEPARGAPTVADGRLFVVSQGNILYALNVADGTEVWRFKGVPELGGLLASANPAVAGGSVVVTFSSGELVALDVKTGTAQWNDALARASRGSAVSGLADISASPVIDDGVVYATGVATRTVAIQLKTGQRLWDLPIGSAHTPAVAGNALFLVDLDDNLMAIDRKTGEVMWSNRLPVQRAKRKHTTWAGPVLAGGSLYLVSNEGQLISVDPAKGSVTNTVSIGDPAMIPPIVANGRLLVLGGNGNLSAFD
jgi:outer membrane protein assembly factor BamB